MKLHIHVCSSHVTLLYPSGLPNGWDGCSHHPVPLTSVHAFAVFCYMRVFLSPNTVTTYSVLVYVLPLRCRTVITVPIQLERREGTEPDTRNHPLLPIAAAHLAQPFESQIISAPRKQIQQLG